MPQNVHGHEIMHLINNASDGMTIDELRGAVAEQFGSDATFHACAGGNWTLDELLQFLGSRGKVVQHPDGRLRTDIGLMCDHGS